MVLVQQSPGYSFKLFLALMERHPFQFRGPFKTSVGYYAGPASRAAG
jgi:hypothetical protein